jgi:alpha-methylacyl-CoA racemase
VPFAGMLLADMGAEILFIEGPSAREARMPMAAQRDPLFRGRARLTLDLKNSVDRDRLLDIIAGVDVLLEGYRPGVMERLGLGPEHCHKRKPALVYGRMTGWGQTGPLAHTAGHDPTYVAITGALHAIGYPDRPPLPPLNIVGDFAGGSMYLITGVLAALLHARTSGQGQVVDAAIIDGTASLMTMVYAMHGAGMWSEQRGTNLMDGSCPYGTTYQTSDGAYMAVCALEPTFYAEFVKLLGVDQSTLPKQTDQQGWPQLRERFATEFAKRTRAQWTEVFQYSNACVAPVLSIAEAPLHPQNVARNVFQGEKPLPGPAPRFDRTPTKAAAYDPTSGAEMLKRWGL